MTEAFMNFVHDKVPPDCQNYGANFETLSAFVREVERRAKIDSDPFGHGFKTELRILGVALEEVIRDFGLDQEER